MNPYQTARMLKEKYAVPDDAPVTVCIKVVPDAEPNAVGVWRKVVVDDGTRLRRNDMWDFLSTLAGEGHHAVAMRRDLIGSFDGKPGDFVFTQDGGRLVR